MSVETHRRCQLTIIAEYVLESRLADLVRRLGAQGYTVHEVRGGSFSTEGERRREGEIERTIEMKVICERAVAEAISRELLKEFTPHFSVRLLLSEVEVLRPAKY